MELFYRLKAAKYAQLGLTSTRHGDFKSKHEAGIDVFENVRLERSKINIIAKM